MTEESKPKRGRGKPKGTKGAYTRQRAFRPEEDKDPGADLPDLFDNTSRAPEIGGVEKWAHDVHLLQIEWAVKDPLLHPRQWLLGKGYTTGQINKILEQSGGNDSWQAERHKIMDKLTSSVVQRHIDAMAEVNDMHIKASRLGAARAMKMLADGIEYRKVKKNKDGTTEVSEPVMMPLRSIDIQNCMSSIATAQQIYRRAMGLPNEEAGLSQILEKVQQLNVQQNNTHQHVHFHGQPAPSPNKDVLEKLTYDEVREFIEFRREQKRRATEAKSDNEA